MAHYGYLRPVPPGTPQHKVLTLLSAGSANLAELHGACANDVPNLLAFRQKVIGPLRKRELLEPGANAKFQLTMRGKRLIATAAECSIFEVKTEPAELPLAPGVERWMLTSSQGRARSMTEADKAPMPVRGDGMDFAQHPSRRGNRLYYRDGRVTDMDGNPIEVAA